MSKRDLLHTTAIRALGAGVRVEGSDVSARRIEATVTVKAPMIERMGVETPLTDSNYIHMMIYAASSGWATPDETMDRRFMVLTKGQAMGPTVVGLPVHDRPLAVLRGPVGTGMAAIRMPPARAPGIMRGRGKSTLNDLVRRLFGEVPA